MEGPGGVHPFVARPPATAPLAPPAAVPLLSLPALVRSPLA
jgi:hypothetical protein